MSVQRLREALGALRGKISDVDLAALVDALRPLDELSLNELCAKIAKIKPPKAKRPEGPDALLVSRYVEELTNAQTDTNAFKDVLDRVKADRRVKVQEATLLARQFLGATTSYKSKPLALKAIAARQFDDKRIAARKDKVSGIF